MRSVLFALLVVGFASTASAQSRSGVLVGYTSSLPDFPDAPRRSLGDRMDGWVVGADLVMGRYLGVLARVDGDYGGTFRQGVVINPLGAEARRSIVLATAGPRFAAVSRPGLAVFIDALFGVGRATTDVQQVDAHIASTATAFVAGGGSGIELVLRRTLDLVIDVQYRRATFEGDRLSLTQIGVAAVYRPQRR